MRLLKLPSFAAFMAALNRRLSAVATHIGNCESKVARWSENPHGTAVNVLQQFDMSGSVALITGGTGWLGSAFAEALAEVGATVIVASTSLSRAQAAAEALPRPSGQAHCGVELNHMIEGSIISGFAEAVRLAGKVDCLVNNGLAAAAAGDIVSTTFDKFTEHQKNNAGYFFLARELRNHIVSRSGNGSVVNIGSMYGQVASYPDAYSPGAASPVAYHTLKGGTIHMTRHMAVRKVVLVQACLRTHVDLVDNAGLLGIRWYTGQLPESRTISKG